MRPSDGQIWSLKKNSSHQIMLKGFKSSTASYFVQDLGEAETRGRWVSYGILLRDYTYHCCDHTVACCTAHNVHTSPHMSCVLR